MVHNDRLAYTIDDFSAAAGIGRTLIYSEIRADRLKPIKVGGRTLITVAEANAWIERIRADNAAGAK